MRAPITAFALKIWDDLNIHSGVSLQRKLAGIRLIEHRLSNEQFQKILQACSDQYERSNSSKFIYAMSHMGSFQAKMDFLARLPGM